MAKPAARAFVPVLDTEFVRQLGLFDSTMIVVGSMIGSGIFIVSAQMARQIGSPGWLLVAWLITGLLTVAAALSYGELAAMMPRAGGQYVYLREAFSPLWGFLYGWTLFMVIQTGTIAAVAVGFARYSGVLWPWIAEERYLVAPIFISPGYALSLSTTQLVGIALIALLTWTNTRGLSYGKIIQNLFTVSKTGALLALIAIGLFLGWNAGAVRANLGDLWRARNYSPIAPGVLPMTTFGLLVALGVSQTGSLFAADAWNNITFTAGEVKDLYGDLLTYVISATLLFYLLTIAGLFVLRRTRPDADRPYRAFGYPIVPALYIAGAAAIVLVLFIYQPSATWPGFVIVVCGLPAYAWWAR